MVNRRQLVKALATAGIAGAAGCSGSNDQSGSDSGSGSSGGSDSGGSSGGSDSGGSSGGGDSGGDSSGSGGSNDGQDVEWPPPRSIVDTMVDTDPGGLIDVLTRIWMNYAGSEYPGNITTTVTNKPGAQGIVMMNELANKVKPNGGGMAAMRVNSVIVNQIGADQANYDLRKLRAIARFSADTRALQFNPRTTPVEDHFEMTWEDFQNLAEEQTLRFPYANSAQLVFASYIRDADPVLNEDNWKLIEVSGGSEARAAIGRGDVDGYFGSYVSNISSRNDSYYTQFCMVNPEETPSFYESIKKVKPEKSSTASREEKTLANNENAIIMNTSFPKENAAKVCQIVGDHHMAYLPPGTPDGIYDIHEKALGAAAESDEVAKKVAETFSAPDHNPLVGQKVQDLADAKYKTLAEDDKVRTLIEENLF